MHLKADANKASGSRAEAKEYKAKELIFMANTTN